MKNLKVVIGILLAIVIIFIFTKSGYKTAGDEPAKQSSTSATLQVVADDWVYGNKEGKVTLIEYLDFECEACGAFYPMTTKLKEEYKDDMQFVVRYFPLPGHKNSMTAAKSVEAAGKQGKFWEMYSTLFENQKEWGEKSAPDQAQFEKYAVQIGLDVEQWKKDVNDPAIEARVKRNYDQAVALNLQGTPSFFLNGKKIENPRGYESFKVLIDKAKNN